MRTLTITLILFLSLPSLGAHAHEKSTPLNTSSELVAWCKEQSAQQLLEQDKTPYNWTASWWTEGGNLHAEGQWKVDNQPLVVTCRIKKGASRKSMTMAITPKEDH